MYIQSLHNQTYILARYLADILTILIKQEGGEFRIKVRLMNLEQDELEIPDTQYTHTAPWLLSHARSATFENCQVKQTTNERTIDRKKTRHL